ncbi:heat-inducible transcriptional repressor HrcA [Fructilactobacillus sanfranciscensis]|uniref:heat-inducible transcriptional repressor HrcA n=1 Tax=Fructilactobacillus sanfranciscensis TaxID=1625 RepID=UPI001CDA99BD|nr:heat-inducible transcriptional repressor HrcA [Fructilactobacillus sanfranciscensis]
MSAKKEVMKMLTERQSMILKYIIDDYSKTGVPIGSKALAEQLPIHVSSATIRNEMAVLSHQNFIEKLHTSSGRVPSNQGYRYYIDNLAKPAKLDTKRLEYISEMLNGSFQQIDEIVRQSADILSHLTDYTALTFSPELTTENTIKHLQLVNLGLNRMMVVIVMGNEQVESQSFLVTNQYIDSQLSLATNLLNQQLVGKTAREVKQVFQSKILTELHTYLPDTNQFVQAIQAILSKIDDDHYFISGQMNMFEQNGKQDFSKIKSLYSMFNNDNGIDALLEKSSKPISVKIGAEFDNDWLKDYSIITGSYDLGNHGIGRIALIGPMRMSYPNMLGVVDAFRHELKNRISGYYRSYDQ